MKKHSVNIAKPPRSLRTSESPNLVQTHIRHNCTYTRSLVVAVCVCVLASFSLALLPTPNTAFLTSRCPSSRCHAVRVLRKRTQQASQTRARSKSKRDRRPPKNNACLRKQPLLCACTKSQIARAISGVTSRKAKRPLCTKFR